MSSKLKGLSAANLTTYHRLAKCKNTNQTREQVSSNNTEGKRTKEHLRGVKEPESK